MAISLLSFFTLLQFTLGLHSIIISHVVFNTAFVCAVVRTRFKYFDHNVIDELVDKLLTMNLEYTNHNSNYNDSNYSSKHGNNQNSNYIISIKRRSSGSRSNTCIFI